MTRHDWPALRREFLESPQTVMLTEFAVQHRIAPSMLRRRAGRDGWLDERRELQERVRRRGAETRVRERGNEAAGFDRTALDGAAAGLDHVINRLAGDPSPLELAAIARALLGYQAAGRKALGLAESAPADNVLTIRWIGHDPTAADYD